MRLGMRIGTIACAGLNIVAGAAGLFAGSVLTWMTLAMGGQVWEAAIPFAFAVGGALYALAGIFLLLPAQRGWKKAIALQSMAILLGAIYLAAIFLIEGNNLSLDPNDEEVVMFLLLPAAALALAILELCYLRVTRPHA